MTIIRVDVIPLLWPSSGGKGIQLCRLPRGSGWPGKWPMSALRLTSENLQQLIDLADKILTKWRGYSDEAVGILQKPRVSLITPLPQSAGEQARLISWI